MQFIANVFPIYAWASTYNTNMFTRDLLAAFIVTIMLIPQSLAYALLAGLPPEVGLYATVLPLVTYAIFGSSRTLSVGPMAIASLMTAVALGEVAKQGSSDYLSAAIVLAFLSGLFLLLMGILRLGFLANFLSHPVLSGFITASAIIIALSQLKHLLGIEVDGNNVIAMGKQLAANFYEVNLVTLAIGLSVILFLLLVRKYGVRFFSAMGLNSTSAQILTKASPIIAVIATVAATHVGALDKLGVAIVGEFSVTIPEFGLPAISFELIKVLLLPAVLISVIGYVESVSIGKILAAKRREKINVNQEFIGLGAANIASSLSGGFPVSASLSRTSVNFDSGAVTQAASIFAAVGVALLAFSLGPFLYALPNATLAATIVIAISTLVDFTVLKKTLHTARSDFYAIFITLVTTLLLGVEAGLMCGVGASIGLLLYRSSKPHIAEVGLVDGTQHFKNIRRHQVQTVEQVLSLRVDESLYFANASYLEDHIYSHLCEDHKVVHLVLMCSAVNEIDYSALEILTSINAGLRDLGVTLHLSEVKGPVMDAIQGTEFIDSLSGEIYLCQYDAYADLKGKDHNVT